MSEKLKLWLYAFRPHTLGASLAPMLVVLGALIAEGRFRLFPYMLCLIVALTAQIASNLANDYFDYKKGLDSSDRVGFERVLTTGKMTPDEMKHLLEVMLAICAISGSILAITEGWELFVIGIFVLIGALSYSAGPYPLSHMGLGDVAVVLFFGLVPILGSYYAIAGTPPLYLLLLALGLGIWEANILVCNNYRDFEKDKSLNKKTLVVRMGESSGPVLYQINSILALVCVLVGMILQGSLVWGILLVVLCGFFYFVGSLSIRKLKGGKLNNLLVFTNRISIWTGALLLIALIL